MKFDTNVGKLTVRIGLVHVEQHSRPRKEIDELACVWRKAVHLCHAEAGGAEAP